MAKWECLAYFRFWIAWSEFTVGSLITVDLRELIGCCGKWSVRGENKLLQKWNLISIMKSCFTACHSYRQDQFVIICSLLMLTTTTNLSG